MATNLDPRTLFDGIPTERPVLIAVSGGSDSIAMLLLAASWANINNADLQVVSVDHGLRPEAAAEAAFVAGVSEALGLMHVTLAWDGIKPNSGISQAARSARYGLLEEFAKDIGAHCILAGHTADDQAETIIMRNRRGDETDASQGQGRGLSGMARTMILPHGTRLIRPLLDITRKELRLYLQDMNQSWIEDPSNLDASYERVRVRNELDGNADRIKEICRFAKVMGRLRKHQAGEAARLLKDHIKVEQGPVYSISDEALYTTPPQVRILVLQILTAIAGGGEFLTPASVLERAFTLLMNDRMTAGHAVIEKRKAGYRFYREKRNLPSIIVGPGDDALWDGRFRVENNSSMSYFCGAPSFEQLQEIENVLGRRIDIRPRAVLSSTPFLCGDGDDLTLPFIGGFQMPARLKLNLVVRAIENFCPEYDYAILELVESLRDRVNVSQSTS